MLKIAENPKRPQKPRLPRPPKYLRPATRRWWRQVVEDYELEPHHVMTLTAAATAWDRMEQARQILAEEGITFYDPKLNRPCQRPEVAVERDSRIAFLRALRELDLDATVTPATARPPALKSNRR